MASQSACWGSFILTVVSEIGDKTFFIAALMSMKHSHLTVFAGAALALFVMTVLSVAVGNVLPFLMNGNVTRIVSSACFLIFGLKMLFEGIKMTPADGVNEELAAVEVELSKKEGGPPKMSKRREDSADIGQLPVARLPDSEVTPAGRWTAKLRKRMRRLFETTGRFCSPVFIQAFSLTMLAEWGDRSQISTVVLAAKGNAACVTLGAILGHAACTGLAVMGGKVLASRISERLVTFAGAILFLAFAAVEIFFGA